MTFASELPLLIALVGLLVILAILLKVGLQQIRVPPLVGYLGLGLILGIVRESWPLIDTAEPILAFMGDVGLICLLFRVGIESNLPKLLAQLRRASLIWVGNVAVSGGLGFGVARYVLDLPLATSLFVAIAMTATSIGVAVSTWQTENVLNTPSGELLLDVAEMDDISAVLLMTVALGVVPGLLGSGPAPTVMDSLGTLGLLLLKLVLFAALCYGFANWIEPRMTHFFRRLEPPPDFTLTIVGIGLIIAAMASLLGFSEAIGAFFAGLVFSRDPIAVKILSSFDTLYDLFVPFFFINIGLILDPHIPAGSLSVGLMLLITAILGKLIGTALPAFLVTHWQSAILLSISMVPRAEIAMVVMQHGVDLTNGAIPPQVLSGMIFVTLATCFGVPLFLRPLLQRWRQIEPVNPPG